jgi:pilus assembly protein Flp/PilA
MRCTVVVDRAVSLRLDKATWKGTWKRISFNEGGEMKALRELREKVNEMLLRAIGFVRSEKGQTLVEYALLLVLIAIVVYIMVKGVGGTTNCVYSKINSSLGGV